MFRAQGLDVLFPGEYGYLCLPGPDFSPSGFGEDQFPPPENYGISKIPDANVTRAWYLLMITGAAGGVPDANGFYDGGWWLDRSVVVETRAGTFNYKAGDGGLFDIAKCVNCRMADYPFLRKELALHQCSKLSELKAIFSVVVENCLKEETYRECMEMRGTQPEVLALKFSEYVTRVKLLEKITNEWFIIQQACAAKRLQLLKSLHRQIVCTSAKRLQLLIEHKKHSLHIGTKKLNKVLNISKNHAWGQACHHLISSTLGGKRDECQC